METTLSGNSAGAGGGVAVEYSMAAMVNSTVSGNAAKVGGGVLAYGLFSAVLSTLSGNSATYAGGGIFNGRPVGMAASAGTEDGGETGTAAPTIGNGDGAAGRVGLGRHFVPKDPAALKAKLAEEREALGTALGGLAAIGSPSRSSAQGTADGPAGADNGFYVGVVGSVVSGNAAAQGSEWFDVYGADIFSYYDVLGDAGKTTVQAFSGSEPAPGDNWLATWDSGTPTALAGILRPLASNGGPTQTHALVAGSPAVDKIPSQMCSPQPPVFTGLDQRGQPRNVDGDGTPSDNECDVGAYELQLVPVVGGPYSGYEGKVIQLDGSASRPSEEITHYLWDCTNDGVFESGAAPTADCVYPDNGTYTARLRVVNKTGQWAEDLTTVTVANAAPLATWVRPTSLDEGSNFLLKLTAPRDLSPVDQATGFTYAFDCGAGYNALSTTNGRSCKTTDNGVRNVRGKIQDKDGGVGEYAAAVTVNNVAPSATFSFPASVNEGSGYTLSLLNRTDPSSADTTAGFKQGFDCGDGAGFSAWGTPTSRSCAKVDDGPVARTVKGRIRDKDMGTNTYNAGLNIVNVAPSAKLVIDVTTGTTKYTLRLLYPNDPSAADKAAGFTYSFDCGNGAGFNAYGAANSRACTGLKGVTYTVRGHIRDKDGGVRSYSGKLAFTTSVNGAIEPFVDPQSITETESQAE